MDRLKSFFLFQPDKLLVGCCLALLILFVGLRAISAENTDQIRVNSGSQTYEPFQGVSHFEGNVMVAMAGTEVTSSQADIKMGSDGKPDTAVFTNHPKLVRQTGNMNQTIQANTLNMGLKSGDMQAQGDVTTHLSGDQKANDISIKSDTQVFDQQNGLMKAIGHVSVHKGDTLATSPEAIIILGPSGEAKKAVFIKGAHLVQNDQEMKADTITVELDTGNIYAEKNTESTMIAKDKDGKPTHIKVQSYLQEVDKDTGSMMANGNTVIHYDDYVIKGPKATFYRENNELNRIVMTGRSQIDDPDRKVTGDSIVITVNPKQFNAKGNVTTFIKSKPQQTASTLGTKGKTGSSSRNDTVSSAKKSSSGSTSKALNEELMIEQATKASEKHSR